jgi:hypothetical protein
VVLRVQDKSSTRVRQPAGGKSSITFGGGQPSPQKKRGAATPARNPIAHASPVKNNNNEFKSTRVLNAPGGKSSIKFGDAMSSPSPVKTGRSHAAMSAKTPKRNTVTGQGDFTPRDGVVSGGIAMVRGQAPLQATQASASAPFATADQPLQKPAEPIQGRNMGGNRNISNGMSSLITQEKAATAVTGGKSSSIRVAHAPGGKSSGNIIGW